MNPESLIKIVNPDFNMQDWIAGTKATVLNKDHEQSIFKDLTLYIFAAVFAVIGIILMCVAAYVCKKHKQKIIKKIKDAKDKFLWNGAIRSNQISFMEQALTVGR